MIRWSNMHRAEIELNSIDKYYVRYNELNKEIINLFIYRIHNKSIPILIQKKIGNVLYSVLSFLLSPCLNSKLRSNFYTQRLC